MRFNVRTEWELNADWKNFIQRKTSFRKKNFSNFLCARGRKFENLWKSMDVCEDLNNDEVMNSIECFNFSLSFDCNRKSDVMIRHDLSIVGKFSSQQFAGFHDSRVVYCSSTKYMK